MTIRYFVESLVHQRVIKAIHECTGLTIKKKLNPATTLQTGLFQHSVPEKAILTYFPQSKKASKDWQVPRSRAHAKSIDVDSFLSRSSLKTLLDSKLLSLAFNPGFDHFLNPGSRYQTHCVTLTAILVPDSILAFRHRVA